MFAEQFVDQSGKRKAAHPHRIDGEEQEATLGVEQLAAITEQPGQPFLKPPNFALRPTSELGRIEDDPVITLAPAHFARGEFGGIVRSEEHTSELQSLMRNSYAVFCLKKKI